jgi:hypothetical protein
VSVMVARPKRDRCLVCALPTAARQEVNAAIWDGRKRRRSYLVGAARVYAEHAEKPCDRKTFMRHADHIEKTWRAATATDPAGRGEEPVVPPDYESLVDKAALVGMSAMSAIEKRLLDGELGDRELVGVAKMGVMARAQQRANEVESSKPQVMLMAVFGLASGHLRQLPETEAIDVFDEADLLTAVRSERALLEERARG